MQAKKNYTLIALLFAATAAVAQTPVPAWQLSGPARYVCGGVADEGMNAITTHRAEANGELLFTGGAQGVYLADVTVTVHGAALKEPLSFTSNGPLCLLKLPKGSYTVDAAYKGRTLKQSIKVDGSALKQSKFNWPDA